MTRAEAKQVLENVTHQGLFNAILFYQSPMTEEIEERHMYADSNAECIMWADTCVKSYQKLDIPCLVYLNGCIYKDHRRTEVDFR